MGEEIKERPILFKGEMVRAILEGRKTVTRRVMKDQPDDSGIYEMAMAPGSGSCFNKWAIKRDGKFKQIKCPYGSRGHRLWVRTNHYVYKKGTPNHQIWDEFTDDIRWVDGTYAPDGFPELDGWKYAPSIHMPRWASRITLEVVSVNVERLQDITEEDAVKEGIEKDLSMGGNGAFGWKDYLISGGGYFNPIISFKSLWNSINGPDAWDKNPWVWRVEFKVVGP